MKKVFVVAVLVLTLMAIAVPSVYGVLWNAGQESIEGDGEDDYAVQDPNGAVYHPRTANVMCEMIVYPDGSYAYVYGAVTYCESGGDQTCEVTECF